MSFWHLNVRFSANFNFQAQLARNLCYCLLVYFVGYWCRYMVGLLVMYLVLITLLEYFNASKRKKSPAKSIHH